MISHTRALRYQVFFLVLYSMGLRLSEALDLTVNDIDSHTMQVHIREGKGGKDRLLPLPKRTLFALRGYWSTHRHPLLLFPSIGKNTQVPMDKGSVQKALKKAKSMGHPIVKIKPYPMQLRPSSPLSFPKQLNTFSNSKQDVCCKFI